MCKYSCNREFPGSEMIVESVLCASASWWSEALVFERRLPSPASTCLSPLRSRACKYVSLGLAGLYIVSRLILLVLMFVLLRKVPPGVYETVSWTNYIPHL